VIEILRKTCICGDTIENPKIPMSKCTAVATGSNDLAGGDSVLSVYPAAYLGCYKDMSNRSLDGSNFVNTRNMTAIACISFCGNEGYVYAGIEMG
jgi:hypothetical protein